MCSCTTGYHLANDGYSCMVYHYFSDMVVLNIFVSMSVRITLMAVHRHVEIRQGHSGVAVIQAMSSAMTVGLAKVIEY